jgi:hypothetical protein
MDADATRAGYVLYRALVTTVLSSYCFNLLPCSAHLVKVSMFLGIFRVALKTDRVHYCLLFRNISLIVALWVLIDQHSFEGIL